MTIKITTFSDYILDEKSKITNDHLSRFLCNPNFTHCYKNKNNLEYRKIISDNQSLFKIIFENQSKDIFSIIDYFTDYKYGLFEEFTSDINLTIWDLFFKFPLKRIKIGYSNYYNYNDEYNDTFNLNSYESKFLKLIHRNLYSFDTKNLKDYLLTDKYDNINKVFELINMLNMLILKNIMEIYPTILNY